MNDITTFFEIFYGSLLALSAIAIVVNRYSWEQVLGDIEDNHAIVMLLGACALFIGLMTVMLHPHYKMDIALLTTLFGWIGIIKGVTLFIVPNWAIRMAHFMMKPGYLHAVAIFSFGLGTLVLLAGFHVV